MTASRDNPTGNKKGLHYFLVCTVCIAGWIVIRSTPLAQHIERYWSRKIEFAFRHLVNKEPLLDERIKLFTAEDAQQIQQNSNKVSLAMIQAIAQQKPKLLFVDSRLLDSDIVNNLSSNHLETRASTLITNGILADDSANDLGLSIVTPDKLIDSAKIESYQGLSDRQERLYGPVGEWQQIFDRIGYDNYKDYGYFEPIHSVGAGLVAMHAGILGSDHTVFYRNAIEIDGGTMQLTQDFLVPLDPPNRRAIRERSKPLATLQAAAKDAKLLNTLVRAGDAVIVGIKRPIAAAHLPVAFSKDEAIVAIINSQLTKSWLRETPAPWFLLVLSGLLGALIASSINGFMQLVSILAVGTVWILLGLIVFAFQGVSLPWAFAAGTTWSSGAAFAYIRRRDQERHRHQLRQAVNGKISPSVAAIFCERKTPIGPAQPRLCTFLSVESKILPLTEGAQVHQTVNQIVQQTRESIRNLLWAHSAVLVNQQDDQMIAMFGATIDGETMDIDHTEAALDAAVAIQKHLVDTTHKFNDMAIFATIGAESGVGMVGGLDPSRPLEFSASSEAILIAGQLRSSCHRYKIMLGPKLSHLLPQPTLGLYPQQVRLAKLETTTDASECREINPFTTPAEIAQMRVCEQRCTKAMPYVRQDVRWPSAPEEAILCSVDDNTGRLVNYSGTGVMIRLDRAFLISTIVRFEFKSADGELQRALSKADIINLKAQVRWSQQDSDKGYLHGLWFGDQLNPGQRELLVGILTDFLHRYAKQESKGA